MVNIEIQNESGDRKYFTIIPNYVLNHSTMWDREVYVQMKRITGEDGTCWTSRNTLAKQCGMSPRRLDKSIKYLVNHKWIEKAGTKRILTKGGQQEVNEYKIADLWKLNIEYYESLKGVAPETPPLVKGVARKSQRGSTDEIKGVAPGAHKEEPIQEDHIKEDTSDHRSRVKIPIHNYWGAEILKAFEEVDPKNKTYYNNKTQRSACDYLIVQYGLEEVLKRVSVLARTNKIPYFPKINSPFDLKEKWQKLQDAVDTKKAEKITKNTPNYIL